jgi:3-methyladenine DNA glycosylase Tag
MKSFETIHEAAVEKHGQEALNKRLPKPKSARSLSATGDDRYLSAMAKCIFQAGFVWKVVENMWPDFEEVFLGFVPDELLALEPEQVDAIKQDPRIIRNAQKIKAVFDNARFISRISDEHGGFGKFLATWPENDLAGLWTKLAKEGSRLGGVTATRFLRNVGKDTFVLSPDVIKALIAAGVVDKAPTGKAALAACHQAFARWHEESGRPYCELSVIAACSV